MSTYKNSAHPNATKLGYPLEVKSYQSIVDLVVNYDGNSAIVSLVMVVSSSGTTRTIRIRTDSMRIIATGISIERLIILRFDSTHNMRFF